MVSVLGPDIHATTRSSGFTSTGSGRLAALHLCTRYPLRLGKPRQCGIQSFPDTSAHGQHWECNPRPSDLEYVS